MTQYKYTAEGADKFNKHGIDLTVYGQQDPSATVVHVNVERGHFQEFYNVRSSYTYYIAVGHGVFYLNGEAVAVGATDLIVVPPDTRIYYFGTMEMILTVAPAFAEQDERHVRFISENEHRHG
jgi:mannose-6-phosphate isomerase-like protein (cupin superfamily)